MKYTHILAAFYSMPWAILPEKFREIEAFLHLKAAGGEVPPEDIDAVTRSKAPSQRLGRVAVLPIQGTLAQRAGGLDRCSGLVSTEELGNAIDGLLADESVKALVLDVDSPGGSVFGISELATKIRGYRTQGKKIVAVANSMAASAAYWIAAQASEFVVTPGGQVGSIGVLSAHMDVSKAEELLGIKTTYVVSEGSPYKAELASEMPLGEEARAEMQSKVDAYYSKFTGAVAKGRRVDAETVRDKFGKGRMMMAEQAKERGMVDRVATMQAVLADLGATSPSGGPAAIYEARATLLEKS